MEQRTLAVLWMRRGLGCSKVDKITKATLQGSKSSWQDQELGDSSLQPPAVGQRILGLLS